MFNIGDKLVCLINKDERNNLTVGKIYTVYYDVSDKLRIPNAYVKVTNNKGYHVYYFKSRFVELTEYRRLKLLAINEKINK